MERIINDIVIRPYCSSDSPKELTQLLHISYKQLADEGFRYLASHQDVDTTKKRIEKGRYFLAVSNDKIVGIISYYPHQTAHGCSWYDKKGVAYFGQFAVLPQLQKKGIGNLLMDHIKNR